MAETLSPNPTMGQKQRLPVAARIQSPTSPFFLGSNDDQLERAQARAARAAAIRRKNLTVSQSLQANSDPCLNKQQILDLFQNCIKLASENVKLKRVTLNFFSWIFLLNFDATHSNRVWDFFIVFLTIYSGCRKLIRKTRGS